MPDNARPSTLDRPAPSGSAPDGARPSGREGSGGKGSKWLWPFELLERIGEGGMGVVYKARYVVNDRMVAVKMLPEDVSDPVVLARFDQEMEILKELKHPNIVRCFGGASENENRFYAMELVDGGSLEDEIKRRGKLPWEQAVEYAEQMAAALQASHERGVIHRDVKPGNFLMTRSGRLKLSDFGLARIDAGRRITRAGKTAGTVLYMAPEQIRGQDLTGSADLYALGCVLYEMLTGRTPFIGDAAATILHAHVLNTPPRLGQLATDCPASLENLVHELLQKAPEDRPESAAAVGTQLATIGDTIRVAAVDYSSRPRASSIPVATRLEQTQPLNSTSASSAAILQDSKTLPTWAIGAAGAVIATLLLCVIWLAVSVSSLSPWRQRWIDLASQDGPQQTLAIAELVGIAAGDADVERTVIALLDHRDSSVREAAANAAAKLESRDSELIGGLSRLAKADESASVRFAAQRSLQRLRGDD